MELLPYLLPNSLLRILKRGFLGTRLGFGTLVTQDGDRVSCICNHCFLETEMVFCVLNQDLPSVIAPRSARSAVPRNTGVPQVPAVPTIAVSSLPRSLSERPM